MKSVLSTKILTTAQQHLLLNAGLGFVHYNAIETKPIGFEIPKKPFDYYIFTSKNAVKSYVNQYADKKPCFCVGEKTKEFLELNGFEIIQQFKYAADLAAYITEHYKDTSFLFLSGNLRKEDIPRLCENKTLELKEVVTYETAFNPKSFEQDFDGLLFYSPSGVQSFTKQNKVKGTCFCIGETTATEAKKHTNKIKIATKQTIENVLVQAIKHLKQND
ncbi:uroporphyrinogen III methyltransferase [Croceivirga lutea]|uniref:uroporphyrinogen-III synthase n=1 Tax=Croceivirga lutea TaxID=1775167 RepID=UPI00163AEF4B|nr:uroporphyrinogen-III synthase [Croceivirga lutea]GGG39675.1 uroporphyrinogen III methyltransferase [Croceivirga lutea]